MLSHEESFVRLSQLQPISLVGNLVRLEPMSEAHLKDLSKIGLDNEIWKLMLYGQINSESDLHLWIKDILERQSKGKDLAFTVIYLPKGSAIGCTRFMNVEAAHRGLEIGGTWYGRPFQGIGVNTESKYLLLTYAFETLGCVRVQFKTDSRNIKSQKAIERLGAIKEGVLRKHMVLPDGLIRDSIYYSILDDEWPKVKRHLEKRLFELNIRDN